ncbi:MAG: ABC transporter substrate-binding protein [Burkholderiaceae bacterium]|jgi:branched-chain amino acid transport system substrate-binding protein
MRVQKILGSIILSCAATLALADDAPPIKIGLVLPLSGPFAKYGQQIGNGVKLYLSQNGDTVNGRKIELLVRDDTGTAPEVTKRLSQELVTRENVDILAGYALTPGAMATASVAEASKRPMIIMNAAASAITTKSSYIVRVSHTLPQLALPIAQWAHKNGLNKVYTIVADYAPGVDAETGFQKNFTAAGGEIVGQVRVPVTNTDFAPYVQRIKDAHPEAVFVFLPPGEGTIAFLKTWKERELDKEGIKLIGTVDLIDDDLLDVIGPLVQGSVTSGHYSMVHDSPENKSFVAAYRKAYGIRPNFMAVAGYDGMHLIINVLKALGKDVDADQFMTLAKQQSFTSPRGTVTIDPATRDIVQTVYIRRTQMVDGQAVAVEFDAFPGVKDPGK